MRFRFTLTHHGSESESFTIPALNLWDTQTGANYEWSTGPAPSVTLPGATFPYDETEYLWVNYSFETGVIYTITVAYTKTFLNFGFGVRQMFLRILDNSFATVFSQTETTPSSPGGTGSVSITFTADSSCDKIAIKVTDAAEVTTVINSITGTSVDPNDITTSLEISEPDGWKEVILKLERDKDFRSLIEFFEGSFVFYGDNGVVNGGIEYIKDLELIYGPDASIEMLIELTVDDYTWEEVFLGQLDLSLAEELMDNKFRIPIIRDNFWAKFMNRRDTPVDLQAVTDLDLIAIEERVEPVELILPSQIITYYSEYHEPYGIAYPGDDFYHMLNWSIAINDDIPLFSIVRASVADTETFMALGLFEAPYTGDFRIQIKFSTAYYNLADMGDIWSYRYVPTNSPPTVRIVNTRDISTKRDFGTGLYAIPSYTDITVGSDSWREFDIDTTFEMIKGEQIAIGLIVVDPSINVFGETEVTWHTDCLLATTQAIALTGEQSIDGTMTSGDRVLVKNQGNLWENGIYVSSAGAWTRATDMDAAGEFTNTAVYVTGGDNQADTSWRQTQEVNTPEVDAVAYIITDNSDERFRVWPGYAYYTEGVENYIKITAKTLFRQTQQPAFLMHDAGAAILKSYGLGEPNPFYSEIMGSALTQARQYDADGCIWNHVVLRGLQMRGYTLAEKPFFTSFNEWWKGCNPIFNLGLTYEFQSGSSTDPIEASIQAPTAWIDGSGTHSGAWNYSVFAYPFTSVNGDGGVEGYTCGTMATVGGQSYIISAALSVFETGVNVLNMVVTWAILDASFEEIETQEFTYITYGLHAETFVITPATDGTYFGVRITNNTVSETKSVVVRMAEGATAVQLLDNENFTTALTWTQTGAGTPWVVGSGDAVLTMVSGTSGILTQEFTGGLIGEYHFMSEYDPIGISGGDTVNLTVDFYDSGNNLVSTKTDLLFNIDTKPFHHIFTSLVIVTKVTITAVITAGTDVEITLRYANLFVIAETETVVVPDEQRIRVEDVEHFYDPDFVVTISNIRNITRRYDNDVIFNKVNIGYTTWKSEDINGIDDPQTQHIYSTRFEKIGQTITLWSDWIAASLAIEITRRKTISESTDFKFDDSVFIVVVNADDVSPDVYRPELDENFSSIENLLDSETRYNISLTPTRNLLRWRKWLGGCLQNFTSAFFKFVRGEGNFDMVSTMVEESNDCLSQDYDGNPLSEKQDVEITDDFIHLPNYYELEVPLDWDTYKSIRDYRKKAIGISMTDEDHVPLFIDELEYNIMHSRANITGWTNVFLELTVPEDDVADQLCMIPEGECANPITDENDVVLTDENGVCIEFA